MNTRQDEIIAKFMNFPKVMKGRWVNRGVTQWVEDGLDYPKLRYSTSWDWLMLVVIKIEGLGFKFTIHNDAAYIERTSNRDFKQGQMITTLGETKFDAIYNTVLEFIKWYNDGQGR